MSYSPKSLTQKRSVQKQMTRRKHLLRGGFITHDDIRRWIRDNNYNRLNLYLTSQCIAGKCTRFNINQQDRNGITFLTLSIKERRDDITKLLLDKGASPFIETKGGEYRDTAMSIAIRMNYLNAVQLLIEKFPKIVNTKLPNGSFPLCMAAELNFVEIVNLLLENNANKYLCTSSGLTYGDIIKKQKATLSSRTANKSSSGLVSQLPSTGSSVFKPSDLMVGYIKGTIIKQPTHGRFGCPKSGCAVMG